MSEFAWEITLITVAGVAATLVTILYGVGAEWWRSVSGRAWLVSDLSVAVLLDLALIAYWFHFEIPAWARLTIYALIAVAAVMRLGAVVHLQWLKRADRR